VIWTASSISKEQHLLPIRFPLRKGLLGWRIFLIRKDDQPRFSNVQSLDDLRQFSVGQGQGGQGWSDVEILKYNGFDVSTYPDDERLFLKLVRGEFDIFSRRIFEAPIEWEQRKDKTPMLHIDRRKYYRSFSFSSLFLYSEK